MSAVAALDRQRLVLDHLHLVRMIAWGISHKAPVQVDLDELIADGNVGLLDAAKAFDPDNGATFATFAGLRVRGAMYDAMRSKAPCGRAGIRRQRQITKARYRFAARERRFPNPLELAGELGWPPSKLRDAKQELHASDLLSLDHRLGDEDSCETVGDQVPDPARNTERETLATFDRDRLAAALDGLESRLRLVVTLYYYERLTFREIGEILGVTEGRVCQLRTQALTRLERTAPRDLREAA